MLQAGWSSDLETTYQDSGALGTHLLNVAVLGPDERRRTTVASSLETAPGATARQLPFYPELDQISKLVELSYDVIIVDLDANPEYALEVVENICARSTATVMVYSAGSDTELMIRCMRAGAREFLTIPIAPGAMAEAMVRASVRRSAVKPGRRADGRLCVFWGAKGGSGVTTVATNFAISAAKESGRNVLLIDLDLPLGDAVLQLGLSPQYSTVDALQNYVRLDSNLLSRLLVKHSSGLSVLAAPGRITPVAITPEAIDRLINVARQEFDCVVVDTGSNFNLIGTSLFEHGAAVYLVSQVGIPELRNANRLVSEAFGANHARLEIVLNRYTSGAMGVDEEQITRALTRKAQWHIPEDSASAKKTQASATPLALMECGISKVIRQMARLACGLPAEPEKKKKIMGLF